MAVPRTLVRTSHALTIRAGGKRIGLINGWTPAQSRTLTPIYEVDIANSGNPVEYMPGNLTGLTIAINRYDIFTERMEEAFGTTDLVMLTRQAQPFEVFETWTIPYKEWDTSYLKDQTTNQRGEMIPIPHVLPTGEITFSGKSDEERFLYSGCWFSSLGRTLRSDDNRIVNVNATLVYTKKLKVTGVAGAVITALGQFNIPGITSPPGV